MSSFSTIYKFFACNHDCPIRNFHATFTIESSKFMALVPLLSGLITWTYATDSYFGIEVSSCFKFNYGFGRQ